MKSVTSLVLPQNAIWRYLSKARKALGFRNGVLVTRSYSGTEVGVGALASGDVAPIATSAYPGNAGSITKRLTYYTGSTAYTATLPEVAGDVREVYVLNTMSATAVTVQAVGGAAILVSGTNAAATSITLNGGLALRLLSDGTKWFHVSNDA